jgi:RNA polymerase-binding transcription factor DksA
MIAPGKVPAQDLAALKRRLREHRRFRQKQLQDLADPSQDRRTAAHVEIQAALTAAAHQVLSNIEVALTRMNTGQYGSCRQCGRPIDLQRLRIVPHTRYCARCHHAEDTRRAAIEPTRSHKSGAAAKMGAGPDRQAGCRTATVVP